ncbi:MAG: endonuclease/exonuclease/phosphatase family protein [Planctomycetota bacterium]
MIRIANWNLDRATEKWRQKAIHIELENINADIWILTETRDSISPGHGFKRIACSQSDSSGEHEADESWVSIWSRLPLVEEFTTTDPVYSACATIKLPNKMPLTVFGTVLPWRGRSWNGHPSAGAIAFSAALNVHQGDWEAIRKKHEGALCVVGDFNQDLSEKPFYWSRKAFHALNRAIKDSELVAVTGFDADPVRTLTDGEKACIDHIFFSNRLVSENSTRSEAWAPNVGGRKLSDHPGVFVNLITD